MVNYSSNLIDYYYFLNQSIIYRISTTNDGDRCGKKIVKRGADGNIDFEANSFFPNIKVEYKIKPEDTETNTKYYWYQSLIKDGDSYTEGEGFKPNTSCDIDGDGTAGGSYKNIIINSIKEDIERYAVNGLTLQQIKDRIPFWCYSNVGDTVKINGYDVTIVSIVNYDMSTIFTDDNIQEMIDEAIMEQIRKYGDSLLKKYNKRVEALTVTDLYVEIGGVKWATRNLGAEKITDYGLYFQWGDTQGYTAEQVGEEAGQKAFSWDDYKYGDGTTFTKYNGTDGKTVLDASDDAVTTAFGSNWRMPTKDEYTNLLDNTTNEWTTIDGVNGYLFTSNEDSSKTLFFPSAGYCIDGDYDGGFGSYWSSSVTGFDISHAISISSDSDTENISYNSRSVGLTIRGIYVG